MNNLEECNKLLRLFHLVDSSIPTGSFAYSYGMESAVEFGFLKNVRDFPIYLGSYLQQVQNFDIPIINSSYFYQLDSELVKLVEELEAMILLPSMLKTSIVQGKNWWRLLDEFYQDKYLCEIKTWFISNKLSLHFLIIFPICLKKVGLSLKEVQLVYIHTSIRDQISSAIRLGFIGPMEAHRLQHKFYGEIHYILETLTELPNIPPVRSSCLLEIAQIYHSSIYSKLFQN